MARSVMLQALLVAAVLGYAVAFPTFFPTRVDSDAPCDAHPDQGFKGHGAPVEEPGLEFTVENGDGEAMSKFCPGGTYTVTVAFDSRFKSKLTVSAGELGEEPDSDCPNLVNFLTDDSGATASSYSTQWKVPCSEDSDDSESAVFTVTGAKSSSSKYMTNTLTLEQKDDCDAC
ncbi:hypothetical protein BSKO_11651 [Bryopsis sp. KO-2023]|nr:hypothetical protein BSKO_11651 [Bryopsis sp. KO-2023]